jgi:tetratricopeptide (TPR) repeat protein
MAKYFNILFILVLSSASYAQHTEKLQELYFEGSYEKVVNYLIDDELLGEEDYFIIANSFHKMGEFQTALYYYDLIREIKHDLKDYFLNKAICEISCGNVDSAERHLFIYENQVGKHAMVYYYFGVIDYEMLEYRTSAAALEEAVQLDPDYLEAWYLLGAVMLEQKKYDKAEEYFGKALALNRYNEHTQLYLAASLMHNHKYDKCLKILESLAQNSEELAAEATYFMGETYFQMHLQDDACMKWKEAAEMGDEFAKKALKTVCEKGKSKKHKPKNLKKIKL